MSLFPKRIPLKNPNPHVPADADKSLGDLMTETTRLHHQMIQSQMMAEMRAREAAFKRQRLPEEILVAALSGWRRWSVEMFGEILLSNNLTKWEPRKRLVAECKRRDRNAANPFAASSMLIALGVPSEDDQCQGIECGCGIYAYKHRSDAESMDNAPSKKTHIFGEVWLWGRIVEHQGGYRAQYAYPKAFVRTAIAERMAYLYGAKLID